MPGVLWASIPSPAWNELQVGPLSLRAYGLVIAMGALVATRIAQRRWQARGGDADDITGLVMWALPAGLVGARLYHVATDWHRFDDAPWRALAVWEGGLGIPGGLAAGVLTGMWVARQRGLPVARLLDVAAPAIPVAQAIGRLGNWFNQELYGRPTELPWGLRIDPVNRPAGLADVATYHPTFLYEALWNLALAGLLVWVERRWHPRPGRLFGGYVAGYAAGRLLVESFRIDPATTVAGLRINIWVSGLVLATTLAVLAVTSRRRADDSTERVRQPAEAP